MMMIPTNSDFAVTLHGLDEAFRILDDMAKHSEAVMKRTTFRIATRVRDRAKEMAPKSPTVGDIRKGTGRKMRIRKARGTSRPKPGGLENSIDFEATQEDAAIFVTSNSDAGAYAFRIHEEKGQTWQNRGLGTISKGPDADDQFITRAIVDQAGEAFAIIGNEQDKVLKSI